jgi:hypothetical protein
MGMGMARTDEAHAHTQTHVYAKIFRPCDGNPQRPVVYVRRQKQRLQKVRTCMHTYLHVYRARNRCVLFANRLCHVFIPFSPPSLCPFPLVPHSPILATLTWCRLAVTCAATSGCTMCLGLTHVRRIAVVMASVSGGSACATRVSRASIALYVAINSPL